VTLISAVAAALVATAGAAPRVWLESFNGNRWGRLRPGRADELDGARALERPLPAGPVRRPGPLRRDDRSRCRDEQRRLDPGSL